jgi:CheY-like chemotaxis protein
MPGDRSWYVHQFAAGKANGRYAEILAASGFTAIRAADGGKAVELFEKSLPYEFDIILMDVQMPVRNGYKATKVIRGLNRPDAKTVIIYACTANTFREDQERARNVGMDGFIAKPIDVSKLMQKLRAGTGITDSYEVLNQAGEEFAAQYTDYDVTVEVVKFAYTEEDEYITGCFDTDHAVDALLEGYFNMAGYIYWPRGTAGRYHHGGITGRC